MAVVAEGSWSACTQRHRATRPNRKDKMASFRHGNENMMISIKLTKIFSLRDVRETQRSTGWKQGGVREALDGETDKSDIDKKNIDKNDIDIRMDIDLDI